MKLVWYLVLFSFGLTSSWVSAATVCAVTLNSSDEKELFKKHFGGEGINFVELTDYAKDAQGSSSEWFNKACASGVRCDSLIVSGHFAGTFFGEHTQLELPLKTLAEKSCSNTCDGILKAPKEVFLFGCNTLADKNVDHRSPEVYRRVLLADGITQPYVDRIVAARYSPVGESFKESMSKVFAGVPKIYGFHSVGPRGKVIAPKLEKMLSSIPSYSEHLEQLEAEKIAGQITTANKINKAWNINMVGFPATSCQGRSVEDRAECGLYKKSNSEMQKMLVAESLMNADERGKYFLNLQEYLAGIQVDELKNGTRQILTRIKNNERAKAQLLAELPKLKVTPVLRFQMFEMAHKIGWVSDAQMNDEIAETLKSWSKQSDDEVVMHVRSLGLDANKAPAIQKLILEIFKQNKAASATAMTALSSVRFPSGETLAELRDLLLKGTPDLQKRTAFLVRNMKIQNKEIKELAQKVEPGVGSW